MCILSLLPESVLFLSHNPELPSTIAGEKLGHLPVRRQLRKGHIVRDTFYINSTAGRAILGDRTSVEALLCGTAAAPGTLSPHCVSKGLGIAPQLYIDPTKMHPWNHFDVRLPVLTARWSLHPSNPSRCPPGVSRSVLCTGHQLDSQCWVPIDVNLGHTTVLHVRISVTASALICPVSANCPFIGGSASCPVLGTRIG